MSDWIPCREKLPPDRTEVLTKIDDENGCRNVTQLKLYRNLWWFPDMSMYVYYTPTHWKALPWKIVLGRARKLEFWCCMIVAVGGLWLILRARDHNNFNYTMIGLALYVLAVWEGTKIRG